MHYGRFYFIIDEVKIIKPMHNNNLEFMTAAAVSNPSCSNEFELALPCCQVLSAKL